MIGIEQLRLTLQAITWPDVDDFHPFTHVLHSCSKMRLADGPRDWIVANHHPHGQRAAVQQACMLARTRLPLY